MLDLQPGVHFHEIELARWIEQEFQRSRSLIAKLFYRGHSDVAHARPQFSRHLRRRRLLDQLLVPALHRAITLAEMNRVAIAVAKHLDLDVAGIDDGALQDDGGITERALRLRPRAAERTRKSRAAPPQPHAAPAATGHRLDHDGEADLFGFSQHDLVA